MESEGIVTEIISQAPNWNFGGDCLLLQWMEQISQKLEDRAKKTKESLDKLTKNINRAQISLENTQNSLNALQYTQYVEMRCQDDETCIEMPEEDKKKLEEKPKRDIFKVFLQNNLTMLHNCHDKFHFLEDSDEDEVDNIASGNNCIYQPRNPYNDRLLPHIFGTKMWKENWHVGLCEEGTQNYSGDEKSDVYSLSSSSSASLENVSMESHNTENLSQWTSSVSLNQTKNAAPQSSNAVTSSLIMDLPFPEVVQTVHTKAKQSNLSDGTAVSMEREPITVKSQKEEQSAVTKKNSIQSKTLNLFDDNDFKSLMSELSQKAQVKQAFEPSPSPTERISIEKPKVDLFPIDTSIPTVENIGRGSPLTVNLFDSPTDDLSPIHQHIKPLNTKPKLDLFSETLDSSDYSRPSFLQGSTIEVTSKNEKKTMISAKSLFDDDNDDDEDDFLNLFAKTKPKLPIQTPKHDEEKLKTMKSSTMLFDRDNDDSDLNKRDFIFSKSEVSSISADSSKKDATVFTVNEKEKPKKIQRKNLFEDVSDEDDDISFSHQINTKKDDQFSFKPKDLPLFEDHDSQSSSYNKEIASTAKTVDTFVRAEPPEDLKSTSLEQKSFHNSEGDDNDEKFLSLFASNKGKAKTKDFVVAEGLDSATLPNSISLFSETKSISVKHNADSSLSSVTNTSIPQNQKPNSRAVEEIQSLNREIPLFSETSKDDASIENETSSKIKTKIFNEEQTIKIPNKFENLPTDEKQFEPDDEFMQRSNQNPEEASSTSEVIPTLSEANEPVEALKTPTYDSFSPLFLDEPPDDDDFFQTISASVNVPQSTNFDADYYEPSKSKSNVHNETKTENSAAQKSSRYSIGLFSDIPPEDEENDDIFFNTSSTKSIPELNSLTNPKDMFEKPTENVVKETQRTINEPNEPESSISGTNKVSPTKALPKTSVSKLKMPSININVRALLPNSGAKPKIPIAESKKEDLLTLPVPSQPSEHFLMPKEQQLGSEREKILPSLCRNRVRGPLKRKPSTRSGRQARYQQSLQNEREEENIENHSNLAHHENSLEDSQVLETPPNILPNLPKSSAHQEQLPSGPRISARSNLFEDFDDNEDNNDFFSQIINKAQNNKVIIEKSTQVLPISTPESNEDLFKISSAQQKTIQNKIFQASTAESFDKTQSTSKNSNALFGSDSTEEDDDDLFSNLSKPKAKIEVLPNISKVAKRNNKSLFSDSEDDDDDLFGSSMLKTKRADSLKNSAPQPMVTKSKTSAPTTTDNPLADLLDS